MNWWSQDTEPNKPVEVAAALPNSQTIPIDPTLDIRSNVTPEELTDKAIEERAKTIGKNPYPKYDVGNPNLTLTTNTSTINESVAAATQPTEPIAKASVPPIDAQQQFLQQLEGLGVDTKSLNLGTAVGNLSVGDLTNRELPGKIDALQKSLDSLSLKELESYSGGQDGVPPSVVNALVQDKIADLRTKEALASALGLGTVGISGGGGAMAPSDSNPSLFPSPLTGNPQDNSEIFRTQKNIIAPTTETEKSKEQKQDGIGKIIAMFIALVTGKNMGEILDGKSGEQPNPTVPDTSVSNPVVGEGTQANAKEQQRSTISQPIKFNPVLNAAIGDKILKFPSATVSADNLFSLTPMTTPNAPLPNNVALNQPIGRTK